MGAWPQSTRCGICLEVGRDTLLPLSRGPPVRSLGWFVPNIEPVPAPRACPLRTDTWGPLQAGLTGSRYWAHEKCLWNDKRVRDLGCKGRGEVNPLEVRVGKLKSRGYSKNCDMVLTVLRPCVDF